MVYSVQQTFVRIFWRSYLNFIEDCADEHQDKDDDDDDDEYDLMMI